ncbi:M23 family metallopeptidase [Amphibacillus indicireducens]|uniref:M23ase beta-sheet core domain-containing protein n=1 Tax=Amphibacillus indicireducens TaxID=1076330 RepID=A0ABP7W2M7_9BACI
MVPNNITKPVKQFTIPRLFISITIILILIPIGLLFHYISVNKELLTKNMALNEEIVSLNRTTYQLSAKIDQLIDERELVINRYFELNEIEEMIHQQMSDLPDEALGGIEIPFEDENLLNLETVPTDDLLLTSHLVDRYHQTIASIEQLEENLLYIPTHWPTDPNKITSPFGPRNDPFNRSRAIHSGIDVRGKTGTPIYAAADGTVQLAQYHGGYGNTIIINHSDRYETLYAHLSKISVEQGDQVLKGDVIGELGSTGRSTGPHLHYEIIKSGKAVDPEPYLNFFDNEIN